MSIFRQCTHFQMKKKEEIMFVHRVEKLAIINSKSYLFLNMYILQVFALKNKSKEPLNMLINET